MSTPSSGADLSAMRQIAESGSESQRIALARDAQTPEEIIELLTSDRSMLVRDFAMSEAKRRGVAVAAGTPSTSPASPSLGGVRTLDEAANKAVSSSRLLYSANMVVLVLSLLGAVILALLGFQSSCIDGSSICSDYERQSNTSLIFIGIGIAITAFWIFAIGNAIASRVELAGLVAQRSK